MSDSTRERKKRGKEKEWRKQTRRRAEPGGKIYQSHMTEVTSERGRVEGTKSG